MKTRRSTRSNGPILFVDSVYKIVVKTQTEAILWVILSAKRVEAAVLENSSKYKVDHATLTRFSEQNSDLPRPIMAGYEDL